MDLPLMPKATAAWLVENTGLTFKQIGAFCGMHELEIQGIADGEVSSGIMGSDPIFSGQLTRDEITRCEEDENFTLKLAKDAKKYIDKKKKARYTPVARRQDKPDGVAWIVKNYPAIPEAKISKLLGTTKDTIAKIKDGSHWNIKEIRPRDPVLLGLCSQTDLNNLIANTKLAKDKEE